MVHLQDLSAARFDNVGEVGDAGILPASFRDGQVVDDRQFVFPHGSPDRAMGLPAGRAVLPARSYNLSPAVLPLNAPVTTIAYRSPFSLSTRFMVEPISAGESET